MRIGLLGAGFIGGEHSAGLRDLIDRQLVTAALAGVYDPVPGRAESFRERFGYERVYPSAEALIEAADVVFVTSPTDTHRELIALAAAAGRPVFAEKPLGRSLAEARLIRAAAEPLPHQIGLILRTSPAYDLTRALVREPGLGRLMVAVFENDQVFPVGGRYASDWRADQAQAGGGTFLEHSIHDVDLIRWMLGEFREVRALVRSFAGHPGVEDLALVQAELSGGGQVCFISAWHAISSRPSTRRLALLFERGRIEVQSEVLGPIVLERAGEPRQELAPDEVLRAYLLSHPELMPLGIQLAAPQEVEDYRFLRALEEGRRPEPDFAEAVRAHAIVEAAYASARVDRPVQLAELE